jgi:hypothetical protein
MKTHMPRLKSNRKRERSSARHGFRGWVYVIDNEGFVNRVKIGYTLDDPINRAREIQVTGHAFPNVVQYHALVDNPWSLEQRVHGRLAARRRSGEWFEVTLTEAIAAVREAATKILFEDEAPRWHPKQPPPSEFARTRLQRERELGKRRERPEQSPPKRGEDMFREVLINKGMALTGCTVDIPHPREGKVVVWLPSGIPDGAKVPIRDRGYFPLSDGPRGDLIVTVRVR